MCAAKKSFSDLKARYFSGQTRDKCTPKFLPWKCLPGQFSSLIFQTPIRFSKGCGIPLSCSAQQPQRQPPLLLSVLLPPTLSFRLAGKALPSFLPPPPLLQLNLSLGKEPAKDAHVSHVLAHTSEEGSRAHRGDVNSLLSFRQQS